MPAVLVIEDDDIVLRIVFDALQEDGFDVDMAPFVAMGITKAGERPPNLIVLDMAMPVMNGWEFMRHYRELPGCTETPVLMTAARWPPFTSFGKYELLDKPFELDKLAEVVARLAA
jgi:CheY-like chemotaxis protein